MASNAYITQTASDNQGKPVADGDHCGGDGDERCLLQRSISILGAVGTHLWLCHGRVADHRHRHWPAAEHDRWRHAIKSQGSDLDRRERRLERQDREHRRRRPVGTVGSTTSATNGGYVGSSTDAGHNKGAESEPWVTSALSRRPISSTSASSTTSTNEAIHQQYVWAKWLADKYYGQPALRNYWNGCSTGGRQGLGLAEEFGYDFDGIFAGAPATWYEEFWLAKRGRVS